jgi:hypothetical protein
MSAEKTACTKKMHVINFYAPLKEENKELR